MDQDTQPKCELYLVNETHTHDLIHCSTFHTQRAELMKNILQMLRKNSLWSFNVSTEELLGEHNFNSEDSKMVWVDLEQVFWLNQKNIFETKDSKPSTFFFCY